ncbi:MAG: anti-sigma F factor [Oscillospiraceae bacterium]|nr:anti-sigma F factor [Oscillospiraceae bacterium]MBQ3048333.1 anti-sigma F factor [Oscillospiraceae bacterium]MBQ9938935.1 anti-sigma F factor [Oscillospiraceae bacterium]
MKPLNEMKLTFDSRSSNEAFARTAVAAFAAPLDPLMDELCDIKTAVSEAVTNCIVHAYGESGIGKIHITARIYPSRRLWIKIRDSGCGIEDIKQAMQPAYSGDQSGERAGLGFSIMCSFTDRVRVSSRPGQGTTVILEKILSER